MKCLDLSEYPISRFLIFAFDILLNSLRSSGYRLEEMVRGLGRVLLFFLTNRLPVSGTLEV